MRNFIIPLLVLNFLIQISVSAQTNITQTSRPQAQDPSSRLSIEFFPFLLKGFGVSYEYAFTPHLTFGPFFSVNQSNNDDKEGDEGTTRTSAEIRHEISKLGVQGHLHLINQANESGPYLLGGLMIINLNTEAKNPGSSASDRRTSGHAGGILGMGYQFVFDTGFLFEVGAHYSNGHRILTRTQSFGNGPTEITENKLEYGVGFDLGLGFVF